MATFNRSSIPDFQLANPVYAGAKVTFWVPDADGNKTAVLATLYAAPTGTATLANPQRLTGKGRFERPVYIADAVKGEIEREGYPISHETGVILANLSGTIVQDAQEAADLAAAYTFQLASAVQQAKSAASQAAAYAASINPANFVLKAGDTMTGVLAFVVGSVLAPGLTPAADGDTGIFSLGADRLNLGAGSTDILEVQTADLGTRAHLQVKKNAAGTIVALVDGATITPDFATGNHFNIGPIAGNRTLANPTNLVPGQSGVMIVTQDATGNRTLTYGAKYKFLGGVAPPLSTAGNSVDTLSYFVVDTNTILVSVANDWR